MSDDIMPWRFPDKPLSVPVDVIENLREEEWIGQSKYDGFNVSIYTDKDQFPHLFSRSGRKLGDATNVPFFLVEQFVEIAKRLPPLSVLNAEFVGPRGQHQPRFFVFDCLAWDGEWLSLEPFEKRWSIATREVGSRSTAGIQLAETVNTDFMGLFNQLKQDWYSDGCTRLSLTEGVIVKRRAGDLVLNRNSSSKNRHQMKLKFREVLEKL